MPRGTERRSPSPSNNCGELILAELIPAAWTQRAPTPDRDPSANGLAMGNPPNVIADAKQGVFASIAAAQQVPSESNGSSSTSQALATLSWGKRVRSADIW